LFSCWQCKKLVLQYIPLVLVNGEKFLEKNDVCALLQACPASQKKTFSSVLQGALLSDAWIEGWRRTREAVRPRSLVLNLACSAYFFSRNSVFLSQQFSRNSVFQPVSAKVQTSERGLYVQKLEQLTLKNGGSIKYGLLRGSYQYLLQVSSIFKILKYILIPFLRMATPTRARCHRDVHVAD